MISTELITSSSASASASTNSNNASPKLIKSNNETSNKTTSNNNNHLADEDDEDQEPMDGIIETGEKKPAKLVVSSDVEHSQEMDCDLGEEPKPKQLVMNCTNENSNDSAKNTTDEKKINLKNKIMIDHDETLNTNSNKK